MIVRCENPTCLNICDVKLISGQMLLIGAHSVIPYCSYCGNRLSLRRQLPPYRLTKLTSTARVAEDLLNDMNILFMERNDEGPRSV